MSKVPKRLKQFLGVLFHPVAYYRHVSLLRVYEQLQLVYDRPFVQLKHLGGYVSTSIPIATRRAMIAAHYTFLSERTAKQSACFDILREGATLWELRTVLEPSLQINLQSSRFAPMEGELELTFTRGHLMLATLTFLFVRGDIIGTDHEVACLIGGLQGGFKTQNEARLAAKANGEIAPFSMLIIAARALSTALGVYCVMGVSSHDQVSMAYAADKVKLDYDKTWTDAGATIMENGLFLVMPRGEERALSLTSRSHRSRTRRKRQVKEAIFKSIERRVKFLLANE